MVEPSGQCLFSVFDEAFADNWRKPGSNPVTRQVAGLVAVYNLGVSGVGNMTPDPLAPDFGNRFAQLVVREGVNVAFLQRIARLSRSVEFPEKIVDDVFNVVVEWERWFRDVKS